MLIAIEGCDRAGKTTLYEQLKPLLPFATFVPGVPTPVAAKPLMRHFEEFSVAMWSALYDPKAVYVADRCPFVDNVVYAHVYNRPPVSYPEWDSELRVLHLDPPSEVIDARGADPWDPEPGLERVFYRKVIGRLQHAVVSSAAEAVTAVHGWIAEAANILTGVRARATHLRSLARRGRASTSQRVELLAHEVALQRARVEELRSYWRGSFGQLLGLPAVGPCQLRDKPVSLWCMELLAQLPPRPSGAQLCHRCDERRCAEPRHVFWGTPRDNMRDALLKGRKANSATYVDLLMREQSKLKGALDALIAAM